jgi:Branched-chain amino acid transport protein (AzlD)
MTNWIDWHAYLVLILVGFLPNEVWRMLGVALARGIDEGSEILVWVRAVATAVLAGVVAQLIFFPAGALAAVPIGVRVGATLCGFAAFLLFRRSVLAGVVVGEAVLLAGALLLVP